MTASVRAYATVTDCQDWTSSLVQRRTESYRDDACGEYARARSEPPGGCFELSKANGGKRAAPHWQRLDGLVFGNFTLRIE
jgi:hypothetical protein